MRMIGSRPVWVALAVIAGAACTDTDSATSLNPEGPPMIRQVRLEEKFLEGGFEKSRPVFAFGTHEQAAAAVVHPVQSGKAANNKIRVIMDELLVGSSLEEIACRASVDDNAFARVPLGT